MFNLAFLINCSAFVQLPVPWGKTPTKTFAFKVGSDHQLFRFVSCAVLHLVVTGLTNNKNETLLSMQLAHTSFGLLVT